MIHGAYCHCFYCTQFKKGYNMVPNSDDGRWISYNNVIEMIVRLGLLDRREAVDLLKSMFMIRLKNRAQLRSSRQIDDRD